LMTSSTKVRVFPIAIVICHSTLLMPRTAVHKAQPGWRRVIAQAVLWGIPTPAFSTALAFFDGYRSEIVPANLIQAQVRPHASLKLYS
jgi:6-phosphogluconate dehydrogenase